MSRMITFGVIGLVIGLGGIVAVGCRRPNASHCGNQRGDLTCEQRGGGTPYCDECEIINDGCVADPVMEPKCASHEGGGSGGSSTSGSSASGSGSGSNGTGDDADSSGGGPRCGNGVIEEGEACDGDALPDGVSCAAEGLGDGLPACALDCADIIYAVCPGYVDCGNDAIDVGEECDNDNLNGQTCDELTNFKGAGLACTEQCTFNTSGCTICDESGEACNDDEDCCDANEGCAATLTNPSKRCCVMGGLGMCAP